MLTISINSMFGRKCAYDLWYYGFNVTRHSVNPNHDDRDYISIRTTNKQSLLNLCERLGYSIVVM